MEKQNHLCEVGRKALPELVLGIWIENIGHLKAIVSYDSVDSPAQSEDAIVCTIH